MSVRSRYHVTGMTCDHCVATVSGALRDLPGVRDVSVDLATGLVEVQSDTPLPRADIEAAVSEAGYTLVEG